MNQHPLIRSERYDDLHHHFTVQLGLSEDVFFDFISDKPELLDPDYVGHDENGMPDKILEKYGVKLCV